MRAGFVGSSGWTDATPIAAVLLALPQNTIVISGGAEGADSIAEKLARAMGMPVPIVHYPDWNLHGRSAGFKRNVLIVRDSYEIFAFWDGQSPGTLSTIRLAVEAGKPCYVITPGATWKSGSSVLSASRST